MPFTSHLLVVGPGLERTFLLVLCSQVKSSQVVFNKSPMSTTSTTIAIADKLRDAFVQMQRRGWPSKTRPSPHMRITTPNLVVLR